MQFSLNISKILVIVFLLSLPVHAQAADKVDFNRDIKPILSDTCFLCHGPDESSRQAGLRLDIRSEALKPTDAGEIPIVPGKPEESEIIKRIFETDQDLVMPPQEAHKVLTPKQKELFKQWVLEGAEYAPHWAYTPLKKPAIPAVKQPELVHNEIDQLILSKLETQGMSPAKVADQHVLLRRLYLDLTGLPPTLVEQENFLQDKSPQAYEKLVDKLMASPRFGERWACWWLDAARYTDTVGFHGDQIQRVFPYRDYVIKSFNHNMPFDQFTREQLAGDLLPHPTEDQLVATCFNRLNMVTREGGAQPKEYLAKYGADRVRTVGTAWLGSTMGCCECHNHKFDPFSAKDFYAMQAFFADIKQWGVYSNYGYTMNEELKGFSNEHPFPPEIDVKSQYLEERMSQLQIKLAEIVSEVTTRAAKDQAVREHFQAWQRQVQTFATSHPTGWKMLLPKVEFKHSDATKPVAKGTADKTNPTKPIVAAAPKPEATKPVNNEQPEVKPQTDSPPEITITKDHEIILHKKTDDDILLMQSFDEPTLISVIRLELIPHAEHQGFISRDAKSRNVAIKVSAEHTSAGQEKPTNVGFHYAGAQKYSPDYDNGIEVRNLQANWKTLESQSREHHTGYWFLQKPISIHAGDTLTIHLKGAGSVGCVRASISPLVSPKLFFNLEDDAKLDQLAQQNQQLWQTFLISSGDLLPEWKTYRELWQEYLNCNQGLAKCLVTKQMEPLTIRVLPRGNWQDESGEVVLPNTPEFLPSSQVSGRKNRLDLANWLCSSENPLTSRAVMNRLWKQFFGTGISSVVEDLGAQGEPPSHPELLDYLAIEFRDGGWDFKRMVKMIVMSRTYQQVASLNPAYRELDPNNRLLSSQNARRLDAEFVRDNALSISGLINLKMGGPACFPYQPAGYYKELQFPNRDYYADNDDRQYRRGVYMHWQRTFLHPMLANFDAPNRDECTANRVYSNTPQQALTLLNDPTFIEASRHFAAQTLDAQSDTILRLEYAYLVAVARKPQSREIESLQKLLQELNSYYKENPAEATKLKSIGLKPDTKHNEIELAAWTNVCRVILNLHETITRY